MAPKAWLGSYKIFGTPGVNDNPPFDVLLKAIDDAVADGMDVINLSLGSDVAPRAGERSAGAGAGTRGEPGRDRGGFGGQQRPGREYHRFARHRALRYRGGGVEQRPLCSRLRPPWTAPGS